MGELLHADAELVATSAAGRPEPRTVGTRSRGDASFVLAVAALLALSNGLLQTVNSIPVLDTAGLLASVASSAAVAFCGVAPGLALLLILERRLPAPRGPRWAAIAGSVLLATALATALQLGAAFTFGWTVDAWGWSRAACDEFIWIGLVAAWREASAQRQATIAALHASELRSVGLQAGLAEAGLQMLLAQIEPHFLFNSLANVRRLCQLDRAAGQAMLADLLQYLRQTLPRIRETDSTLAREAEVARAFLAVHKIRMGERLQIEFAIPAELSATRVPPMMLLTLIENALKHGLAPLPEGGLIRVAAQREGDAIRVSVADTGRGLVPGRGRGTGLANIRARLRSEYGTNASLGLQMNDPRGVVASIVLPSA